MMTIRSRGSRPALSLPLRSVLSSVSCEVIAQEWNKKTGFLDLYTDAAGGLGFGAYLMGHWAFRAWPENLSIDKGDITFKELFPIVLALNLWRPLLNNRNCDNQAVVSIVNKQSSESKSSIHLLRLLVSVCLQQNIIFKAVHVPGVKNKIVDSLSCFQITKFRSLVPTTDRNPTPIPADVLNLLCAKSVA